MEKPKKPYEGFPLTPHNSGKWYKKIKGKCYYFGKWDDWESALADYLEVREYLYAGVEPPVNPNGFTIADACSEFYDAKQKGVASGAISQRTLNDYRVHCKKLIEFFGENRTLESLTSHDFRRYRESIAASNSPVTLANCIAKTKAIFNWCYTNEFIEKPVRFGAEFKKPSKAELRKHRYSKPPKEFSKSELHSLVKKAGTHLKAMILLAINSGLGQMDISHLEFRHVDLQTGWVDYPRIKTGIKRSFPLWPETLHAINESISKRPNPKPQYKGRIFVTKYGLCWVRDKPNGTCTDSIQLEFRKLKKKCGINGESKGFYAIRHTFRTIADECKDQPAIFHIMGHMDATMAGVYRERIAAERLEDVTEYVRNWFYSDDLKKI